ncbi:mechanosensitive ion channel protein MscL [Veillonella montpellierensis DNF00314]|uniref:Large-conductance mechanosensitive channel n=1 Tax=Veillonella montpellierensis DNF00314 TaxID=1401067 RepID=A0A096CLW5_9FIRM|nr:large conductance mechanosensitive channel protein MscL [Veillonella montpellierensis]KGF46274.1 mechanosensitive ion channel protein MscL [Veillonella montpellierensis DNF00314]
MKALLKEFKRFAFKGNMIDLAVGMIIGAAFTGLVNSIVNNLIMPIISLLTAGIDFNNMYLPLNSAALVAQENGADLVTAKKAGAVFAYGSFITDLVQFIILAFVVFMLIRLVTTIMSRDEQEKKITTKTCPFCKSEIPLEATKCAHCTSDID